MFNLKVLVFLISLSLSLGLAQTRVNYFSFTADPQHVDELESLIATFEAENPDIKINYTTAPFDSYFTKLQTDFAAGNPPDVFDLNYENFVTFASRDTLLPLTDMLTEDTANEFYPTALHAFGYKDVQYGLPITFSTVLLFYNKDLFDAAGVAYPTSDWTWDDVIAAGKKITDPSKRVWGIHQAVQFWEFYKVAAQAGGGLKVGDTVEIDTPENQKALHYLVDKVQVHKIMPSDAEMSGVGENDLFKNGQLGMLVTGIWMFDSFSDIAFNWDIAVEPGETNKATHFFSNAAVIAKTTPNAEAAWKWVQFLAISPATVKARIDSSWELPALSLDHADVLQPYLEKTPPDNREAVFESLQYAITPPVIENQPLLEEAVNTELEAARLGTKTVEQALADAQKRVEELASQ
jgi:multiple sugar transport system substrate-binding protein